MRIAAHVAARVVGGAERRSIDLLARLAARGHDVIVYCNSNTVLDYAQRAGLASLIQPLRGDLVLQDAFGLARQMRRQAPDVLVIITFRRAWLAALAARIARVPRIVMRVGLSSDVARSSKYRFVLGRWVDDVVLNAESLLEPFRRSLPPSSRARITVIPNGVTTHSRTVSSMETRAATRAAARAILGIEPDVFAVGTLARLVRQKRIDRLLDAVALIPDVHAIIGGEGARRRDLQEQADEKGIADRVHFLGHIDNAGAVLAALDVFVVASDQEGMSNAMLEALAAGVPVVSTAVSGAREALTQHPVCGIVVDASAEAIAAAIRTMMELDEERMTMGRAAMRVAEERYSSDRMTDAWEALLIAGAAPEA